MFKFVSDWLASSRSPSSWKIFNVGTAFDFSQNRKWNYYAMAITFQPQSILHCKPSTKFIRSTFRSQHTPFPFMILGFESTKPNLSNFAFGANSKQIHKFQNNPCINCLVGLFLSKCLLETIKGSYFLATYGFTISNVLSNYHFILNGIIT